MLHFLFDFLQFIKIYSSLYIYRKCFFFISLILFFMFFVVVVVYIREWRKRIGVLGMLNDIKTNIPAADWRLVSRGVL